MSEDLAFAIERSFLAQEFLTWLWFRCEVEGGEFKVGDQEVAVVVEDALALTSWDEDGTRVTVRGGTPTLRPETAGALAGGLTLKKARLLVAVGDREWQLTLDGDGLDLSSVKVPPAEDEDDDPLAEKLAAGEELRDLVDGLYEEFLALRLGSADWDQIEVPRIVDWVKRKLESAWGQVGVAG